MSQSFILPGQTFTLESLVALEQWTAIQTSSRRKTGVNRTKAGANKQTAPVVAQPKKDEL